MKNLLIIVIATHFIGCEPIVPQQTTVSKQVLFEDYDYENIVGLAKLMPVENGIPKQIENQVVSLRGRDDLLLSFDLLTDQFENLGAKIFHCNKDWSKSRLRDMEFLSQINNYRITEFNYSQNTVQPYINYQFTIPKPFISGNYIIAVYRRGNPNDILLTRRFIVYDNRAKIDPIVRVSTTINKRELNHQIEYSISYGDLLVNAPAQDITPVLIQNHNWNTVVTDIPPTLIRLNEGYLEYRHLDLRTNFPGWNEYRFADLRTLSLAGRNVGKIKNTGTYISAPLLMSQTRNGVPYTLGFQDINGNYIIQNTEPGQDILNADYALVTFTLKSEPINGKVYVIGRFNNWNLEKKNEMVYTNQNGVGRYQRSIPLKQGYYEYLYYVESDELPEYYMEGSHFQAEQEYEILVYYRQPGTINDQIIGYSRFRSIER